MKSKGQRTVEQMKGRASCGQLGKGSRSKRVKAEWRAFVSAKRYSGLRRLPSLREYASASHGEARAWLDAKRA